MVDLAGQKETTVDGAEERFVGSRRSADITHINGVEVFAGDEVDLGSGEVVRLNADGTLTLLSDGEGEENAFSYTVKDGAGNTDSALSR